MDTETGILDNGTFFRNVIFPSLYYDRALSDNGVRKKYGLVESDFLYPPRTDIMARKNNLFNKDANYRNFGATLSTTKGQIAIASGILTKRWEEGCRSYYTYKLEEKSDYFFSFVSADYAVVTDEWISPSGKKAAIEMYHSPKHKNNLGYFVKGIKISFDYNSKNYLEYPHSVIRVIKFPAHSNFA